MPPRAAHCPGTWFRVRRALFDEQAHNIRIHARLRALCSASLQLFAPAICAECEYVPWRWRARRAPGFR